MRGSAAARRVRHERFVRLWFGGSGGLGHGSGKGSGDAAARGGCDGWLYAGQGRPEESADEQQQFDENDARPVRPNLCQSTSSYRPFRRRPSLYRRRRRLQARRPLLHHQQSPPVSSSMSTPTRPRVLPSASSSGTPRRAGAPPRTPAVAQTPRTSIKDQIRLLRQAARTPASSGGTPGGKERREAVRELVRKAADTGQSSSSAGPARSLRRPGLSLAGSSSRPCPGRTRAARSAAAHLVRWSSTAASGTFADLATWPAPSPTARQAGS